MQNRMEINISLKDYFNEQNELRRRKSKEQVVAQRRVRKATKKSSVIENLITVALALLCLTGLIIFIVTSLSINPRYAIAGEDGKGNHFIYVTEIPCNVYEVKNNLVTVEYKGNLYSFRAYNTELEVGDEVVCRFTDDMKLYDTIE